MLSIRNTQHQVIKFTIMSNVFYLSISNTQDQVIKFTIISNVFYLK